MKKRRLFVQTLAVLLCLALLCPLTAFAEDTGSFGAPVEPEQYAVIDPDALQELVDNYVRAHQLNKEKISVGYCYLDTGDTWYYNGDAWYFGAGVYYVPLTMILAEWESGGKISRDTNLQGASLGDLERYVLVYSNNYYAHQMMNAIGSDKEVRAKYMDYSPLPEDYYDPDFLDYSYFSARFLTDVMKTLYTESERFPNIIDCLKLSDNGNYFHGAMRGAYEVAQKYGNYIDRRNVEYNNTTGIIYTPHPFILTVMTENMGITQEIMWDMAVIFRDYTLSLDEAYDAWDAAGRQTAAPAPAEPEPAPAAEEQPAVQEEAPQEQPSDQQAELIAPAAPEEDPSAAQPQEQTAPAPAAPQKNEDASNSRRMVVLVLCAAALVILILAAILKPILRKKKEKEEDEEELLY